MKQPSKHSQIRAGGSVVLELDESCGKGAEAEIFGVVDEPHLAVKLLHTPGRSENRLDGHLSIRAGDWLNDDGRPRLTWPIARAETLLKDSNGHGYEGHVMLRLPKEDWLSLDALISGKERAEYARHFLRWDELLVIARDLAKLVADMHTHARPIIAADLKAKNAFVSRVNGAVALVDCDSMIVRDPDPAQRSIVSAGNPPVSEETVPPELLENMVAARTRDTDAWAVAVLVCELLMDGQHPFTGTPGRLARTGNHSVTDNVVKGRTIFKPRHSLRVTHQVPPEVLPHTLQQLARKCFIEGHGRPRARPAPAEWVVAINALAPVRHCERLPKAEEWFPTPTERHTFSGDLPRCPWCALITGGAPDAFPPVGPAR